MMRSVQVRRYGVVGDKVVKYLGKSEPSERTSRDEQHWWREDEVDVHVLRPVSSKDDALASVSR